ncbi:MAG: AAA family ATPase [Chloroflexota bacterium]
MKRIVIIGTSGAGKSTLARQLAARLNVPHIELDGLYWAENWTKSPQFLADVTRAVERPFWIIDGNYSSAHHTIWAHADTIIWLDYSIWVCYWRMLRRVLQRILLRQELWGGNRETFRKQFFSKESLFVWIYQTHGSRRQKFQNLRHADDYSHLTWVRHASPRATKQWLNSLGD